MTPAPSRYLLLGSVLMILPASGRAESWSGLPPPPALESSAQGQDHFWLRRSDLLQAGIAAEKLPDERVDLRQLPGADVTYDETRQRLLLTVPPAWLPAQRLGQAEQRPRFPARASNGALLNYDVYLTHTDRAGSRLSSWNELRRFGLTASIRSS